MKPTKKHFLYGLLIIAVIAISAYNITLSKAHTSLTQTTLANLTTLSSTEVLTSEKNAYVSKMDSIFALADKSSITTGLLSDAISFIRVYS
jgi:hypothetical protein